MARHQETSNKQKGLQGHGRFIKNTPNTKPIDKLWRMPSGLSAPGKHLWKARGEILVGAKMLTSLDFESFSQLCFTYDTICDLRKTLSKEGYTSKGRTEGSFVKHPAFPMLKSAMADFKWLSEKFGLNPLDRARLNIPVDPNPEDHDRDFLFGDKQ